MANMTEPSGSEADIRAKAEKDIEYLRWKESANKYHDAGLRASLWGKPANEMTREDLICFIGFLDELAYERTKTLLDMGWKPTA